MIAQLKPKQRDCNLSSWQQNWTYFVPTNDRRLVLWLSIGVCKYRKIVLNTMLYVHFSFIPLCYRQPKRSNGITNNSRSYIVMTVLIHTVEPADGIKIFNLWKRSVYCLLLRERVSLFPSVCRTIILPSELY